MGCKRPWGGSGDESQKTLAGFRRSFRHKEEIWIVALSCSPSLGGIEKEMASAELQARMKKRNSAKSAHTALAVKACLLGGKQLH